MLDLATYDSDEVEVTFEFISRSRLQGKTALLSIVAKPPDPEGWTLLHTSVVDAGLMAFTWMKHR